MSESLQGTQQRLGSYVWMRRYLRMAVLGDMACVAVSLLGLVLVRRHLEMLYVSEVWLALFIIGLWPLIVMVTGGYDKRYLGDGSDEYRRIFQATAVMASSVAIVAYATQTPIARGYVMAGIPLAGLANVFLRYGMRQGLHRRRYEGECMRRVVVVGHWASILELHTQLSRKPYHGMKIVAACVPSPEATEGLQQFDGFPVLGDFSTVPQVVRDSGADTVAVLACPELDGVALRRLAWRLEETDTDLYVASALMEVAGPRINIRPVAGLPLLHVAHPDLDGARQLVKGVFDKVVAALALLALSPFLLVVAALIKSTGPGPVLFRQARVGKGGEEFTVLKFRTMVPDAEQIKRILTELNEGDGVLFKIRNDPRITPLGSWLRRYSIDELPQLFNVVRGDMSLVGPRPPLPEEVARYGTDVRRRLVVKPGLTGLWQVSGRSDLSWEESVRLDLRYVENWSLALDMQILWKTWSAVMRGSGAY
ncbi:sugar transferase [Streptosporangium lutulentum]|uniref:Exopolysaccharide biosynthesis polyprenyl glycosylphosphotransferase n=1 Tax=Streptosporangium lutulentum TaxID=1461250 RepID=A0ABT9QKB9_9ACTN|nr:exopolysaccharide biosynthesis polyprenyl glycosylphosphotransferase [Streptosporangium lutulentum]